MKKRTKRIATILLTTTLAMASIQSVFACTGVIVGKKLTKDGSFIFGRTEDYERNRTMRLVTHKRGEFKKGSELIDVNNGFRYIHPEDSLKFFSTPDSTKKPKEMEQGVYDAAGYNEMGVGIFCTVSASPSEEIEKADPFIKDGVNEASMTTFLLAHAKSAKGAIELLAKTIDEKGASMGDVVAFGDQKEVWYMEIYSGHQYCAIKYPEDKFSVFPNAYWLGGVDFKDKENVIASKNIVEVAKKAGTYVETEDGLMDLAASYSPKELSDTNRSRVWSGIHKLDPNSKLSYDEERFPLLNSLSEDSEKIDIRDALNMFRDRFEGTEYKAGDSKAQRKKDKMYKRPIGSINTMQAHIFQIKDNYPKEAPGLMWMTLGSPLNIPYVPIFADINDSSAEAKNDAPTYDQNSYYWVGSSVNDLVSSNRENLGESTRKKVLDVEDKIFAKLPEIENEWLKLYKEDKEKAAEYSTKKTIELEKEVFQFEKNLQVELSKKSKVDLIEHWAQKPIIYTIDKGYMTGIDELSFAPNKEVTRGELVTILARLSKADLSKYKDVKNERIEENKFYTDSMKWALENKLLKDDSKSIIKSDNLNREELSYILYNYMTKVKKVEFKSTDINFADAKDISDWAKDSVSALVSGKILNGRENNKFAPKDTLTRAELAQIIYTIENAK